MKIMQMLVKETQCYCSERVPYTTTYLVRVAGMDTSFEVTKEAYGEITKRLDQSAYVSLSLHIDEES